MAAQKEGYLAKRKHKYRLVYRFCIVYRLCNEYNRIFFRLKSIIKSLGPGREEGWKSHASLWCHRRTTVTTAKRNGSQSGAIFILNPNFSKKPACEWWYRSKISSDGPHTHTAAKTCWALSAVGSPLWEWALGLAFALRASGYKCGMMQTIRRTIRWPFNAKRNASQSGVILILNPNFSKKPACEWWYRSKISSDGPHTRTHSCKNVSSLVCSGSSFGLSLRFEGPRVQMWNDADYTPHIQVAIQCKTKCEPIRRHLDSQSKLQQKTGMWVMVQV